VKGLGAAAAVAALLVIGSAFDTEAQAQSKVSACKGLAQSDCKANASCTWVAPKKGKQKPYCRTKTTRRTKAKAK
jgi:hypothetical protein